MGRCMSYVTEQCINIMNTYVNNFKVFDRNSTGDDLGNKNLLLSKQVNLDIMADNIQDLVSAEAEEH